jgi:hypothetical protein
MKLLLYAGLLYLIGIATVLVLQPSLMFREDGVWKEFGIGRASSRYTWMPFWLFSILWAVLSYMCMLLLASSNLLPGIRAYQELDAAAPEPLTKRQMKKTFGEDGEGGVRPGYYILNPDFPKGPRYIFLGEEIPNMLVRR